MCGFAEVMIEAFDIPGPKLITPKRFGDDRGFFSETYNQKSLADAGIEQVFVQDNHSKSVAAGVVRGLHFQTGASAQGKLVRCSRGAILDVVVDIRFGSPTYGQHVAVILSEENWSQLWVPVGFAHGFCTLEANSEVQYKVTAFYDPAADKGLAWNDSALAIAWPVAEKDAVLSAKDQAHPSLRDLPKYFEFEV